MDEEATEAPEAETVASTVPPHLLLMSKHSLLAAIQKLDERINEGEEERDHLQERERELRKKVDALRVREQRMGRKAPSDSAEDEEALAEDEEDEEERLRAEGEAKARLKEEELRRREEQYAFEHFSLQDSTDAALPLWSRIYSANHTRAARAHHHFDRLYLSEAQPFPAAPSDLRPPPLERPSSYGALTAVMDADLRSSLDVPRYTEPSECELYRHNLRLFPVHRQRVAAVLARRKRKTFGLIRRLAAHYLDSERRWLLQEEQREAKRRAQPPLPACPAPPPIC